MKRYLPVMVALAVLLWLPAGASAYEIEFKQMQSTLKPETSLNYSDGVVSSYAPPLNGAYYGAGATSLAQDANWLASADWSVIVTQPQVQWGSGGVGKDTYFTTYINSSLILSLSADGGADGYAGYFAKMIPSFLATRQDLSHTPQLQISVSWGGLGTAGLSADVDFYGFAPAKKNPFGDGGFSASADDGTTLASAGDLDAFLDNPSIYWYLSVNLAHAIPTFGPYGDVLSGEDYSDALFVAATVHLIEPDMTNPDPAPVPPSLLLLGSGLLTLALARRRHKGHRQVG